MDLRLRDPAVNHHSREVGQRDDGRSTPHGVADAELAPFAAPIEGVAVNGEARRAGGHLHHAIFFSASAIWRIASSSRIALNRTAASACATDTRVTLAQELELRLVLLRLVELPADAIGVGLLNERRVPRASKLEVGGRLIPPRPRRAVLLLRDEPLFDERLETRELVLRLCERRSLRARACSDSRAVSGAPVLTNASRSRSEFSVESTRASWTSAVDFNRSAARASRACSASVSSSRARARAVSSSFWKGAGSNWRRRSPGATRLPSSTSHRIFNSTPGTTAP